MTGSELFLAATLDLTAGDPRWFPHPVRGMGAVIAWCDTHVRTLCHKPSTLRAAGLVVAFGLPILLFLVSWGAIVMAEQVVWWLGSLLSIGLAWTTLAGRDLWDHVGAVRIELEQGNLSAARQAVSHIVGRDTDGLSQEDIARATVETVAESLSDGIVAPLFYLVVGGAPLALAYKAVNTLDSMVGHKDERYIDFGWASARLDDLANWIPSRLSAVLILLAAGMVMGRNRSIVGWQVLRRDGGLHPSPNSGRPEAAMAGVLGVRLGGVNYYAGVAQDRPFLGREGRGAVLTDITMATHIMVAATAIGVCVAGGLRWLL